MELICFDIDSVSCETFFGGLKKMHFIFYSLIIAHTTREKKLMQQFASLIFYDIRLG